MTGDKEGTTIKKESTSYRFHITNRDRELIGMEMKIEYMEYANLTIGRSHAILRYPSNYLTNSTVTKWDKKGPHGSNL